MTKKPAPKKKPGSQAAGGGKRSSAWSLPPEELLIVGIDLPEDAYPDNPALLDSESNANPAELDEAMIANVRYHGIIEPVVVWRDGARNVVLAGRTRVRWARCAKKLQQQHGEEQLEVPYIVRRGKPAMLYGVARSENRRRPEDSPMAQAQQLSTMLGLVGGNEEEAAIRCGVAPVWGKKLLKLLDLAPQVQKAVERGMSVNAAVKLAPFARTDQVAKLAEIEKSGEKPTARAVTNKLREGSGKAPVETPARRIKLALAFIDRWRSNPGITGGVLLPLEELRGILDPQQPNGAAQPAVEEAGLGA